MTGVPLTVSVIIPIVSMDEPWRELLHSLLKLEVGVGEVLIVAPFSEEDGWREKISELAQTLSVVKWVRSAPGRAQQMNAGAREARGDLLWFLHADSEISLKWRTPSCLNHRAIYYHDLQFDRQPFLMRVNEVGVWLRSHFLKMPFGDQGFLVARAYFDELGGYSEDAPYGEDHLLVWQVLNSGGKILPQNFWLKTSARKYRDIGWGTVTKKHLSLTYKQAAPEFVKYIKGRVGWRS